VVAACFTTIRKRTDFSSKEVALVCHSIPYLTKGVFPWHYLYISPSDGSLEDIARVIREREEEQERAEYPILSSTLADSLAPRTLYLPTLSGTRTRVSDGSEFGVVQMMTRGERIGIQGSIGIQGIEGFRPTNVGPPIAGQPIFEKVEPPPPPVPRKRVVQI